MEQLKMTKDALPIGGCLPMLLQFPLLIAFYTAVTVSLEVRQASFIWLPDLSAADPWHMLEFAFAISMILSMKFTPQAATVTPEQQMQQKMMTYFMPIMMLWVMWAAPSGLLLYWFFGNIVSFGQQMVINRMNKTNDAAREPEIVDTVPKGAKKVKPKIRNRVNVMNEICENAKEFLSGLVADLGFDLTVSGRMDRRRLRAEPQRRGCAFRIGRERRTARCF